MSLPLFAWFDVHGVGAVGSCGAGFSVRVVCGVRSCARATIAFEVTLRVLVLGGPHLFLSVLYHYCLPSIVDSGLSAIVVNLSWLWALNKEFVFVI